MSTNECILAIIIPIYNAELYIDSLIETLENSKYKNLMQLICIDDGSTDNSHTKLKNITKKYTNVEMYYQENKGVSSARNKGLGHVHSQYVYFIDADDSIDIHMFDKVFRSILKENPDLSIFGIKDVFYTAGKKKKVLENYVCDKSLDETTFFENIGFYLNKHILYSPCNKIYKYDIIRDHDISFNEFYRFGEDMLFNLNYFKYVKNARFYEEYVYYYRHNLDSRVSGSSVFHANEKEIFLTIIQEFECLLKEKGALKENEIDLNKFIVRKLSALLNGVYSKASPIDDAKKKKYIYDLYNDKKIWNAIIDTNVSLEEVDQKLLHRLHKMKAVSLIHALYKLRNR